MYKLIYVEYDLVVVLWLFVADLLLYYCFLVSGATQTKQGDM
jgi:hypothetical protein